MRALPDCAGAPVSGSKLHHGNHAVGALYGMTEGTAGWNRGRHVAGARLEMPPRVDEGARREYEPGPPERNTALLPEYQHFAKVDHQVKMEAVNPGSGGEQCASSDRTAQRPAVSDSADSEGTAYPQARATWQRRDAVEGYRSGYAEADSAAASEGQG